MDAKDKILIIDDELINRETLTKIFSEAGYQVSTSGNEKGTFEILNKELPGLILLDMDLGNESGLDLLKKIKKEYKFKHIFIVLISGKIISSEEQANGIELGADGYITRPIARRELVARIEAFFRHKRTLDSLRKSEETLIESRARLIVAQQIGRMGDFRWVLNSNEVTISEGLEDLLQYSKEEINNLEKLNTLIHHPEDRQKIAQWLNSSIKANIGRLNPFEYRVVRADGKVLYVRSMGVVERKMGKPVRVIATILDITKHKRTEIAIKESESRLRNVVDATPFPVALIDTNDDKIIYWSQSAKELFGHTASTSTEWYQLAYPDPDYRKEAVANWKAQLEKAKLSGDAVNAGEYKVTCKDGLVRICELHAKFIPGNLIVTFNDITEKKKASAALIESEERIRLLLDSTAEGIYGVDRKGNCIFINASCQKMLGYAPDENLIGKNMHLLMHHTNADGSNCTTEECTISKAYRKGQGKHADNEVFWRKDGSSFPVEYGAFPIYKKNGLIGAVVNFTDITDRKKAEEEIVVSQKRYQDLFDNSPIPLWEEDFSGLIDFLNEKKSLGVKDFRKYFSTYPEQLQACAKMIKVLNVNKETLKLNQAKTKTELIGQLDKTFTEKSFEAFNEELIAIANGENKFQVEGEVKTLAGELKHILLKFIIDRETKTALLATIDVTARKQSEDALRESEKLFATLYEYSPVAILTVELPSGKIMNVNARWSEVMGYTREETIGLNVVELNLIDEETRMELRKDLLSKGFLIMKENEIKVKSGDKKTILSSHKLVDLKNKQFALISIIDISERKIIEKELIESERKINTLLGNLPGMVYRCKNDPDWTMLYVSKGSIRLTGYLPEELTSNKLVSYGSLIHPEDKQLVWDEVAESIRNKRQFELEYRIMCRNKEVRWVWERGIAVETLNDGTTIIEGLISDITEEQQVKEELKNSEERFRTTLDTMLEGCQILDKELRYTYLNNTAVKHSRTTREKLLNNHIKDVFPAIEQTEMYKLLNDSLNNHTEHEVENEFIYPDGTKGWFELKIQPVPEGVFILSQDITKRKKIEETLKQNKAVLEAAGKMAQIGGWELDAKTMEVTWTEETYRIHEVPLGTKPPLDEAINFYHPDDRETLANAIQRAFDFGEPYDMELRFITAKGKYLWVRTICRPLIKNGKTVKLSGSFQNITNRKKIEESLKEKEQFLNTLLNAIPVPVFYKDKDGKYLGLNKAFIAFTGIERAKLVGKTVFEIHPPDLAEIYHNQDKKLIEKGGSQRYESEIQDKKGNRFTVIFNKATFNDDKGKVNGLIGTILDITRLKNIETELIKKNKELELAKKHLEKSEKRLKEAHVLAKLGNWEFDFGTNRLWWPDETCRIFEVAPDKFTGSMDEFLNFVHPDDREREIEAYQNHLVTKKPYEIDHRIVLKNNKIKHIHEKCQTEFDKNGNPIKSIGTIQDFTEIKQIENKLLKLNEELEQRVEKRTSEIKKLSEAVKHSPSIVFITNPEGVIEYINLKFKELTGYTEEEVLGQTPRLLNSGTHPKKFFVNLWKTIKAGKVWRGEVCNKKKSGELYWETVSISSIKNKNGEITHFVSVRADITQRKAMEQELKKAKEEAEKANRAKSEFLANMSHEIRTPMNAVFGFADLLSQMVTDDLQRSYLESIKSSGKNLLTLINDILDLSKIEAGKLELELNYVDLNELFREMKTIFSLTGLNKGIEYAVNIAPNVPPLVLIDEIRLHQVLMNLLSNAFKFTPKGYIYLSATATNIEPGEEFFDLCIDVEDSGIGISEESQAKIFDAFSQQEGQSTKKYGGTGLGLTISQKLVSLMNGKINLKTEVDKGTTFSLVFEKIKFTTNKLKKKEHAKVDIESIRFMTCQVLIVDDIDDNRKYLAGVLTNLNIKVIQAINGKDALEKLNGKKVDLIITDLRMPNFDGFQLKKHLSQDNDLKDIPVIAASASAMKNTAKRSEKAKFSSFLIKPFQIDELLKELIKYLPYQIVKKEASENQNSGIDILHITDSKKFTNQLDELVLSYVPLKEQQSMQDVELFGKKCIAFGKEFKVAVIEEYGNQLITTVNGFDIELMLALIDKFESLVSDIKEIIKTSNK